MIKWNLSDLPELKVGDCLAFEAIGLQKIVHIIGAKSCHWAMVGERLVDDSISEGDYSISDSTFKGISTHLLNEYRYWGMRVYRPKLSLPDQRVLAPYIIKRYCYYGICKYDWFGILHVALWVIFRKIGFKVAWWESKLAYTNTRFWCLEFNEIVWRDLGYPLVPENEPPHPGNMENSSMLELIWGTY